MPNPGPSMMALFDLLNEHVAAENDVLAALKADDKAGLATAMSRKVSLNGSGEAAVRAMLIENPDLCPVGYDPNADD